MQTQLTDSLAVARQVLTEAKIALRHAEADQVDCETALTFATDWKALGSNNDLRDQGMAEVLRADEEYQALVEHTVVCQDAVDRCQFALDVFFDQRRQVEATTWARLADYVSGRVDKVHHAPEQAARQIAKEEVTERLYPSNDPCPF